MPRLKTSQSESSLAKLNEVLKKSKHKTFSGESRELFEFKIMRELGWIPAIFLYGYSFRVPMKYFKPRKGLIGRLKDLLFGMEFVEDFYEIKIPSESINRLSELAGHIDKYGGKR